MFNDKIAIQRDGFSFFNGNLELKDILYSEYSNNKQTLMVFIQGVREILNVSFYDFVEMALLESLTTLKGRTDAIKKKYGFRKNIPIFINSDLIYFALPLENQLLFVNALQIQAINSHFAAQTEILFKDGNRLLVNNSCRLVKNRWRRALVMLQ